MKNLNKKDIIYLWIINLLFLGVIFLVVGITKYYGSQLDWLAQHIPLAEYMRTLFYETHDLFPDFAFNIGGGQNIYNFSYYGLLSPFVLVSYFFPKVKMIHYMITMIVLSVVISNVLLYSFLRNKKLSSEACLLATLMFTMSAPIAMHSHRHFMFINYMPFLILGLFGVDKKINDGKSWLLTLSVFLMIMTSYYFSIGGIIALIIYAIYMYLAKMKKVTFKDFMKFLFHIAVPFVIAVLSSCIVTLPTLATILYNRAESNVTIGIKELLLPSFELKTLLYYSYGLGLNIIIIPAIIHFFKNKKENLFMAITLSLLVLFNLFNYILNGTMYIDAKTLIPFLPLYILVIGYFIQDIIDKKVNYKILIPITIVLSLLIYMTEYKQELLVADLIVLYLSILLYHFTNKKILLIIPILLFTVSAGVATSKSDYFVLKLTQDSQYNLIQEQINNITDNDKDYYRINNNFEITETPNEIYENINYLNGTTYSSVSNQTYNEFYYDVLNNNIPARNKALTLSTTNIMSNLLNGNKYIISRGTALQGYEKIDSNEGVNIYVNENVLPLGFATSNIISYEDFNELSTPAQEEAMLKNIIADSKTNNDYVTDIKPTKLDFKEILQDKNITEEEDGSLTVEVSDTLKINYTLPEEYQNKIIFIRFNMNNSEKKNDLSITINNVRNKLTASSWKYYNDNEVFDYVISTKELTKLTFKFTEGTYNISDFESYVLDYASLENISKSVDKLEIDRLNTKGDRIIGTINVSNDGYFMMSIPYDNGFTIKIDGEKVKLEKLDDAFIGCKISKGMHDIEVEYKAPLKDLSLVISTFGIIIFIAITYLESRKKI